jgi:DNA-binding NarL/FixJ family response regulator
MKMIDELVVWLLRLNKSQEAERYLSYYSLILKGAEEFDMNNKQHRIAARSVVFFFIKNNRALDAITILNNLIDRSIKYNHYRRSAEWYKYIAIGQQILGHKDCAIEALVKSLKLSVLQNYLRMYIDDFVEIAPILKGIKKNALNKDSRAFVERILKYSPAIVDEQPFYEQLTGKEREVLRLLNNGFSNKDIANDLAISVGTLKWHLHNIYSKLGVKNRVQALLEAKLKGVI